MVSGFMSQEPFLLPSEDEHPGDAQQEGHHEQQRQSLSHLVDCPAQGEVGLGGCALNGAIQSVDGSFQVGRSNQILKGLRGRGNGISGFADLEHLVGIGRVVVS